MGKANKKKAQKKKQQQEEAADGEVAKTAEEGKETSESHDAACGSDHEAVAPEEELDAKAKADRYMEQQQQVYDQFIKDYVDDEIMLDKPIDFTSKQKDFEKRERDEQKKFEKIQKREATEIEDLFNDASMTKEAKTKALKKRLTQFMVDQQQKQKSILRVHEICSKGETQLKQQEVDLQSV